MHASLHTLNCAQDLPRTCVVHTRSIHMHAHTSLRTHKTMQPASLHMYAHLHIHECTRAPTYAQAHTQSQTLQASRMLQNLHVPCKSQPLFGLSHPNCSSESHGGLHGGGCLGHVGHTCKYCSDRLPQQCQSRSQNACSVWCCLQP